MQRVFHFSGGPSSALMVIENYTPGDLVIFCDTGREHNKTYKFINDFEANECIPVIRLTYPGGWKGFLKSMKGVPNRFKRKCTIEMKIKRARRYLRSIGIFRYVQFVGFRTEEINRRNFYKNYWQQVTTYFPLTVDNEGVNQYWSKKNYKLEIPSILKNCILCFQKGEDKVIAILTNYPEYADEWISDEEDKINNPKGYTYFTGVSMRKLRDQAQVFIDNGKIFSLDNLTSKFSCSCNS